MMTKDELADAYQRSRADLTAYLARMVVRHDIAEELAQEAALRLIAKDPRLDDVAAVRPWLFRVASRLAIDHLRAHSTWREDVLTAVRHRADGNPAFQAESLALVSSPEMAMIAREHLGICLSCTLRNLPAQHAAALLLTEVHDFTLLEAARILEATPAQVKNWLQAARARMRALYDASCALVGKQGVCYQCVELSEFFNHRREDPLDGTPGDLDARFAVVRSMRTVGMGRWHVLMTTMLNDMLNLDH